MKRLLVGATVGLTLLSSAAFAESANTNLYVYGNYSYNNLTNAGKFSVKNEFRSKANENGLTKDVQHNRFGLGVGYKVNQNFAVELGYKDLGRYSQTDKAQSKNDISYNPKALEVRAVGILPITDKLALEGTLGAAVVHAKYTTSVGSKSVDKTRNNWTPTAGVGVSYALTDNFTTFARYEYVHFANAKDTTAKRLHANTFDVGVRYAF